MTTNEEGNEKERCIIRAGSEFNCYLLAEIALSMGIYASLDTDRVDEVFMYGSRDEVQSVFQAARRANGLLRLRQFEGLAEAIRSVGETPSAKLLNEIAKARLKVGFKRNDRTKREPGSDRLTGLN
jgi:hypothetical protein